MYQRKSDGLWAEAVTLKNGKKKVLYGKTKNELRKKLVAFTGNVENGVTISEALEVWQEFKADSVSYKTLEGYAAPVKRINCYLGDCYIKDITPAQIQAMVRDIAAKGYKRSTVQRPLDILRMMFDYFITLPGAQVSTNPCAAVRLPSGLKQGRRDLISREDAQRIRESLYKDFGLFAYFLMYSGLRKGEALALRWEDIHDGFIHVSKSLSWQPNQPVIKQPKTEAGIRTVPLLAALADVLPKSKKGYVFSPDGGKSPLTQIQFRHRWEAYCKAAGLSDIITTEHTNPNNRHTYVSNTYVPRISPHQLRHEFVTLCFDAGLDEQDTQVIVGHASASTTREVYNHIKESRKILSADKLDSYLKNNIKTT
jgi:integrase